MENSPVRMLISILLAIPVVVGLFMIFGTLRMTDLGVMQQETFRLFGFVEHFGWAAPGTGWIDWITIPMC